MLIEILILFCALVFAYIAWMLVPAYLSYRFYSAQGVVSSCDRFGFSNTRDLGILMRLIQADKR